MTEITPTQNIPYKVEAKGSLWVVTLERGEYSDWQITHYLFSGNSEEEVWELVKVWAVAQEKIDDCFGLIWGQRAFQFGTLPDWKIRTKDMGIDVSTSYGDCLEVKITRASVIYVRPEKLFADNLEVKKL